MLHILIVPRKRQGRSPATPFPYLYHWVIPPTPFPYLYHWVIPSDKGRVLVDQMGVLGAALAAKVLDLGRRRKGRQPREGLG